MTILSPLKAALSIDLVAILAEICSWALCSSLKLEAVELPKVAFRSGDPEEVLQEGVTARGQ